MAYKLYESDPGPEKEGPESATRLVSGTVVNDCEGAAHGNVLVRIPALGEEVWARLVVAGGGQGTGIYYQPRIGDEVLVGLSGNDAFVMGGMFSPRAGPPVDTAADAQTKRVIRSGLKDRPDGHRIELDDGRRSLSITSTTGQRVTLTPEEITLSNKAGTVSITLTDKNKRITVKGADIELEGTTSLTLKAPKIDITSTTGAVTINAQTGATVIGGHPIKLN
ncbi:phage tail protein [Streptomyces albiflavescens]|uniref:Phage tail protein n=1 Tax=Streptomyces albiflavescens TaxID=1623582 RepID=A0A918DB72_9ACTN|nr:phage baseplate assembly protein V [Streptomyces albiflavescens]GGN94487.1 phage tail protein [Streptomyces albiflavescens]